MRTIGDLLTEHPFFAGFDQAATDLVAGCARNVRYRADEYLTREGEPADQFYVIHHGRVALEVGSPARGRLIVDTGDEGDVVGWEWLVAPYRSLSDVRAVQPTSAIALDGACLRGKCAADPRLGYAFLQRVTQVMFHQLVAARMRLLDLYGAGR